jgi:transposase
LTEGGLEQPEAVSINLGLAYIKAVRARAPDAVICFDPIHVIKLVTDAPDSVRRQVWQSARRNPNKAIAKRSTRSPVGRC